MHECQSLSPSVSARNTGQHQLTGKIVGLRQPLNKQLSTLTNTDAAKHVFSSSPGIKRACSLFFGRTLPPPLLPHPVPSLFLCQITSTYMPSYNCNPLGLSSPYVSSGHPSMRRDAPQHDKRMTKLRFIVSKAMPYHFVANNTRLENAQRLPRRPQTPSSKRSNKIPQDTKNDTRSPTPS